MTAPQCSLFGSLRGHNPLRKTTITLSFNIWQGSQERDFAKGINDVGLDQQINTYLEPYALIQQSREEVVIRKNTFGLDFSLQVTS